MKTAGDDHDGNEGEPDADDMEIEGISNEGDLYDKDEDGENKEISDLYIPQFFPVNDEPWVDPI